MIVNLKWRLDQMVSASEEVGHHHRLSREARSRPHPASVEESE